ncbi:VanW family protein [Georgenia sp. MJ170]|uniref:VanW family protein n=1 Tax=Georgenia sunbinii TaxID=3117728 RepID=UPI002F26D296
MSPDTTRTDDSPLAGFEAETRRRDRRSHGRRRRRWIVALVVLVVLIGGYLAAAWYFGERVPRGTTVAGVDIGGLPAADAVSRLETDLADAVTAPVPVVMGDSQTTLDPVAAGLAVDAAATVDRLSGLSFDPRVLFAHLFGGSDVDPVVTVDEDALQAELTTVAEGLDVAPVDGAIELLDGEAQVTEAVDGLAVDVDAAADEVVEQWLLGPHPVELTGTAVEPHVTAEATSTALNEIARPLTRSSVSVSIDDRLIELTPQDLTAVAAISAGDDGVLRLELDGETLVDLVLDRDPEVTTAARDARIVLEDGSPTVVPGATGMDIDTDVLVEAVAAAAVSDTDRTAVATLTEVEPELTTAGAEALGVVEVISEFSTPFHNDPQRTENLRVGAQKITNVLVQPGESFSLIESLGPITTERGFVSSGVVVDGLETSGMGGGLSQVSTTVFNAAFFAGMEFEQFQTHSHHYPRYPEGREATMYTPSIDLRWKNTTPYGALVQAWVSGGELHVRLWGTEHFDVSTTTSHRYNFTQPTTVYSSAAGCVPHGSPERGFTVNVSRTVTLGDEVVAENSWTTRYIPWDRVVCGSAP